MNFRKWIMLILVMHGFAFTWFVYSGGNPERPDTERYLDLAEKICNHEPYEAYAERNRTGYFSSKPVDKTYSGQGNLGANAPEIFRTPGYPAFICTLDKMGLNSSYGIVLGQFIVLYASFICFYYMAVRLYGNRVAKPALLALLVSPGSLVYSLTLYSEVLFLCFLLVAVFTFLIYLKELKLYQVILSAVFFALAFYVRAGVVYVPFLFGILTVLLLRQSLKLKALHMVLFISLFVASISPWIVRNYSHYGKFYISGQLSNTLAIWHLPDVWAFSRGEDPNVSRHKIRSEIDTIVEQFENENRTYVNNVEFYDIQQKYAKEQLLQDWQTYAKAWGIGMWSTATTGYLARLYYMFSGNALLPISDTSSSIKHQSVFHRLLSAMALAPSETLIKIFIHIERFIWISTVVLAIISVGSGALRLDVSAWVILAVVSYFIFIPGTMGYSRFRFAVDWLIVLQAILGANLLYAWLSSKNSQRQEVHTD